MVRISLPRAVLRSKLRPVCASAHLPTVQIVERLGARLGLFATTLASFTPYRWAIGGLLISISLYKVRKDTVIQVGAFAVSHHRSGQAKLSS
jgi:hypothetical protein